MKLRRRNQTRELFRITEEKTVSARDIHRFLESRRDFSDWIKNKIDRYGFVEGEEFVIKKIKSDGGRPRKEYMLTVTMAKEICMVARSKRGQQARTYFLKTEEKYLKMIQAPEVPLSAEDLLLQQVKEHIKRKKVLLQKPENFVGQLHNSLEKPIP